MSVPEQKFPERVLLLIENRQLKKQNLKKCGKCRLIKPLHSFRQIRRKANNKTYLDYLNNCNDCTLKIGKKEHSRRIKNIELEKQGLRICSKCYKKKPLSDFWIDKSKKSKYESACSSCQIKNHDQQNLKKENENLSRHGLKRCSKCREIRTINLFKKIPSGYASQCRICQAAYKVDLRKQLAAAEGKKYITRKSRVEDPNSNPDLFYKD